MVALVKNSATLGQKQASKFTSLPNHINNLLSYQPI